MVRINESLTNRQALARMRESARLLASNNKAQDKEAKNIFRALPLSDKMKALQLIPTRPSNGKAKSVAILSRFITESIKTTK